MEKEWSRAEIETEKNKTQNKTRLTRITYMTLYQTDIVLHFIK